MSTRLLSVAVIFCSLIASSLHAGTIHVSPGGDDAHPGSSNQPVASLTRAIALASEATEPTTILVHEGSYHGPVRLLKTDQPDPPRITIAAAPAADGGLQEAILDGSYNITKADAIEEMPGVYAVTIPAYSAASIKPEMWELDTRVRYNYAADLRGVAARPATFFHEVNRERVVFHTSDGKPPTEHQIGLQRTGSRTATRLWIQRHNVTVRGLVLKNAVDIVVDADNVVIEDCRTLNAIRAIIINPNANNTRVTRHHAVDVATGVLSHGNGTLVEDSTFLRPLDRFTVALNTQDQSGIQFYAPAVNGTARGNLVAGFQLGIFMKGVNGNFLIENNTAVGPGRDKNGYGIFNVKGWKKGDICRNNIVTSFHMPMSTTQTYEPGFIHENNWFWDGSDHKALESLLAQYREIQTGQGDHIADPQMINPAGGDYRLAHDSPLVSDKGKPLAGALAVAPADVKRVTPRKEEPAQESVTAKAPSLLDKPVIRTNTYGASIEFKTTSPVIANVLWGWDPSCQNRIEGPRNIERRYDSNVGNEFNIVDEPISRSHHFATIIAREEPTSQNQLFYRLELVNAAGMKMTTDPVSITLAGEARTWHVAPNGNDDSDTGPLRTIQAAIDRALPGDRILLADGLYGDRVVIRHGGVAAAPLLIEAQNEHQAMIDTDQSPEVHTMFQIDDARHVTIRGLEFRWFYAYAIYAYQTDSLKIERCKFWNMHFTKGRRSGVGVFATRGKNLLIDHSLFFNMNAAFDVLRTDGFTITNNTALRLTHRVALFHRSAPGLLRNNSFTFTGNYHYHISLSPEQFAQFDSDYNNLAQFVHMSYAQKDDPTPSELAEMMDTTGEDPSVYPWGNKGIAVVNSGGSQTVPFFSRWQQRFGKDKHSVFAHPRYVDPRHHDFRLQPESPNIGAGVDGQMIGACGVAER